MSIRARVTGTGFFVPDNVVTNDDLAKLINTNDEWIQQRTGIRERRYVPEGMSNVDMAEHAATDAMKEAGRTASDVQALLAATLSPDYTFPSNAPFIQERLGIRNAPAIDLRNQCTGFLYGLATADVFIRSGRYERVLLVGSEIQSSGMEFADRSRDVTVIFGDAAGAFMIEKTEEPDRGILSFALRGDGRSADDLATRAERAYEMPRLSMEIFESEDIWPRMKGRKVFLEAVRELPEIINKALERAGVTLDDVDLFAFHQANLRINQWVASSMNIPDEKVWNNIERYGNTTAATIPSVIHEARQAGFVKDGSLVCAAGFGAGFTSAAVIVRW
ncbi:MAG: ketoacyl-ACP synthase III [Deltaproteobacteria bacterium]|nr:ketoacyl-ACP synthase III [Deltaproteobacteria bacterium]